MQENTGTEARTSTAVAFEAVEQPVLRSATVTLSVTIESTTLADGTPSRESIVDGLNRLLTRHGQNVWPVGDAPAFRVRSVA